VLHKAITQSIPTA